MKKLLLTLLVLLTLGGCAKTTTKEFTGLTDADKQTLLEIKQMEDPEDSLNEKELAMIGQPLKDFKVLDISNKEYDLSKYDKVFIQVEATWCPYCKQQVTNYNDELISKNKDVLFIQLIIDEKDDKTVFTKEDIEAFYKELNKEIPENLVVAVSNNTDLIQYLMDLGLEYLPTMVYVQNGQIRYCGSGLVNNDQFQKILEFTK